MKLRTLILIVFLGFTLTGCASNTSSTADMGPGINAFHPPDTSPPTEKPVPPPNGEDIVRTFIELINEGRLPEALSMLTAKEMPSEDAQKSWQAQFSIFKEINVTNVQPYDQSTWKPNENIYKVTMSVKLKPSTDDSLLPNFGWDDGENIRFITIVKDSQNIWKVDGIGTGP